LQLIAYIISVPTNCTCNYLFSIS